MARHRACRKMGRQINKPLGDSVNHIQARKKSVQQYISPPHIARIHMQKLD